MLKKTSQMCSLRRLLSSLVHSSSVSFICLTCSAMIQHRFSTCLIHVIPYTHYKIPFRLLLQLLRSMRDPSLQLPYGQWDVPTFSTSVASEAVHEHPTINKGRELNKKFKLRTKVTIHDIYNIHMNAALFVISHETFNYYGSPY